MSVSTSGSDTGPQYDNPETATALREQLQQREQEREAEVREHLSIKEKLQQQQAERTFPLTIGEIDVDFRPIPGSDAKRVTELAQRWMNLEDEAETAEEAAELFEQNATETYEILAEYSADDDLDLEFWRSTYPIWEAIPWVRQVNAGGTLSEAEIKRFR